MRDTIEKKIKEQFDFFDRNNNGVIERQELLMVFQALGGPSWTLENIDLLLKSMDTNSDGRVQYSEFIDYVFKNSVGEEKVLLTDREMSKARDGLAAQGFFDRQASEDLLEQAVHANYYKGPMKLKALKLLQAKADPNFCDRNGCTVLLHMASKIDAPFAKLVIDAGANVAKHVEKDFTCPIFVAASKRDTQLLRLFLMPDWTPPEPDETQEFDESQFSQDAKEKASKELTSQMATLSQARIGELVQKRADLNYKDSSGWTPLTMATFYGRKESLEALIRWGGEARGQDKLRMNVKNRQGRSAVHIAARKNLADIMQILIANAADPNIRDPDGWTPLHHACFNGNSNAVHRLIDRGASFDLKGFGGLTPYQVTRLRDRPGTLSDSALELIKLPEDIDFAKKILPIIKDETTSSCDKIDKLLSLRGVCQNTSRLRFHDQFFDPISGPNKVKLQKIFNLLMQPVLRDIRTGNVGMDPSPPPNASDGAAEEHIAEVNRRQQMLSDFACMWMEAIKGPRQSIHWNYDNKAAIREELTAFLDSELFNFREELDGVYSRLCDQDGGEDLVALPADEVFDESLLTQLGAHPKLDWLETLNVAQAFDYLRLVGCISEKKDEMAVLQFAEMLAYEPDFLAGKQFWKNIYRKWLAAYAKLADQNFHRRIQALVDKFNEATDGQAVYTRGPVKTYERMWQDEFDRGLTSSADTFDGRTTAATCLDVVRGTITVDCPNAILDIIDRFKELDPAMDKLKVVRIKNDFNADTDGMHGYRYVQMNTLFRYGLTAGACERENKSLDVAVVGEVVIVLKEYEHIKKRRSLQYKLSRGFFDWPSQVDDTKNQNDTDDALDRLRQRGNAALYEDDE
eukprot:TRINITY_DN63033_c0_g1_i1.p1 TRINITY_DN63033_c0_g1~~TRINITY_DN63033_c0_g1_i1.p1  ORF type:complete len:857 (+),score=142.59 TRINITY_DN63033_c0_g1_i1:70-2640(+)